LGDVLVDRQSEAYRKMTPADVVEELPESIVHPPVESLDELSLPKDYPELKAAPKSLAQAEGRLFERIMDPTAPDDNSSKGSYVRMQFEGQDE
jgi:hypothetical protein